MKLELLDFIKNNSDWKNILSNPPYSLIIQEDGNYILFKYNQIESDFSKNIVREARGITFRKDTWKVVSRRYDKFFNIQEKYADKIDWNSAKVQEKIDGSLIAVSYDDKWMISTNGTIDAFATTINGIEKKSFGNLFLESFQYQYPNIKWEDFTDKLNKDYTYILELCHPLTRIVVPHKEPKIYHTGTRNNITGEELIVDIGVMKPKDYSFNSLEDVLAMAQTLPFSEEGYVVVDKFFKKNKIKSPAYLSAHHLKNNGVVTYKRVMELILKGEHFEFISVFPEYKKYFDKAEEAYNKYIAQLTWDLSFMKEKEFENRKRYALQAVKMTNPSFLFLAKDNNWDETNIKEYLNSVQKERLVEWLKLKDEPI